MTDRLHHRFTSRELIMASEAWKGLNGPLSLTQTYLLLKRLDEAGIQLKFPTPQEEESE